MSKLTDQNDDLYCIYRLTLIWRVVVQRQRLTIVRNFRDRMYGDKAKALAEAKRYRDAVLDLFPPLTNRDVIQTKRRNNTSGFPGVNRVELEDHGGPFWVAELRKDDMRKYRRFSIAKHGERKAKALAVALRQQWVDEIEARFHSASKSGNERAQAAFPEVLADVSKTALARTIEEGETKLRAIDAEFDARQPAAFNVRLSFCPPHTLLLGVSTGVKTAPPPSSQSAIAYNPDFRSLAEVLSIARDRAAKAVEKMYDAKIAAEFLHLYQSEFTPRRFNRAKGLTILASIKRK